MAVISLNRKRDEALNEFARKYRDRTLCYLQKAFSLSREDCEDVFQESSIVLYRDAGNGKLDNRSSSLYTYFIGDPGDGNWMCGGVVFLTKERQITSQRNHGESPS